LPPSQDLRCTVDMTGRPLADTHQVAPRRTELEQIVEGGNSVDPAERKAEFVGRVLESLLGQIVIMVLAFLQNSDQGIGLAAIVLQVRVILVTFWDVCLIVGNFWVAHGGKDSQFFGRLITLWKQEGVTYGERRLYIRDTAFDAQAR
jgi:hypothetical protein